MRAALLIGVVMLAACARPPRPIAGDFPSVQVSDVQSGAHAGERVRWGGMIVQTRPETDRTCFEMVSLPLDARARPRLVDQTYGRFEACAPGFYDPEIYEQQREVTVVGTVQDVVAEAFTRSATHRAFVMQSLAKVRELCVELGLVTPWTRRFWQ